MNSRLHFVASETPEAQKALARLRQLYGDIAPENADIIVALGGDGFMLQTLHGFLGRSKPIFGMNLGSVGFLMNE
jgi:NAD+ kinase